MAKKRNSKNAGGAESPISKDVEALDVAILASLVSLISQILGLYALFLQAEAMQEDEEEEVKSSANNVSNDAISPERLRKLEKQVQSLSKEVERLRG